MRMTRLPLPLIAAALLTAGLTASALAQDEADTHAEELAELREALADELEHVRDLRRELEEELVAVQRARVELERTILTLRRDVGEIDGGDRRDDPWRRDRHDRDRRHVQPVTVTVTGGKLEFGTKHETYETFTFDILPGETREIEYYENGGDKSDTIEVQLSDDGRTLLLGTDGFRPLRYPDTGWRRGVRYDPRSEDDAGGEPQRIEVIIRKDERRGGVIIIERDRH